jgi:hypothetical protein
MSASAGSSGSAVRRPRAAALRGEAAGVGVDAAFAALLAAVRRVRRGRCATAGSDPAALRAVSTVPAAKQTGPVTCNQGRLEGGRGVCSCDMSATPPPDP